MSSYAPDEPVDVIHDEMAWLQGAFVSSLLCGVQITLSAMSFLAVLKQRLRQRLRIVLLVYIFVLCALMTAGQQSNLLFVQKGFIESRNSPGGPNEYLSNSYLQPASIASSSLFVFANWMMETLLVWRCGVVCSTGDRPLWFGVVAPFVLLLSEYVTGVLVLNQMIRHHTPLVYGIIYTCLSLLLNLTVTIIIAGRLLLHRRRALRQLGPGQGSHYASAATILIESASLYASFCVLIIIFLIVGTPALNILQQAIAQVEAITSLLIIYRIAQGKEWKPEAGVSTGDWRGDAESQVGSAEPATVHLEMVEGSQDARTDGGAHAPSILSKEDEAPTTLTTSSVSETQPPEVA